MREHSTRCRLPLALLVLAMLMAFAFSMSVSAAASAAPHHGHGHKHGKGHKKGNHHKKGKRNKRKAKARKASAPLSGIYDACAVSAPKPTPLPDCGDRLVTLRQGGFQVVLNYWTDSMSLDENLAYAEMAQAAGVRLIWNLSNYRAPLGPKLDLVRATKDLPVTWGYYIGDEVRPENAGDVSQLSSAVKDITGKPLLFVSRPNPSLMKPFRKLADYIGPDDYPYGPWDPPVCQTSRWVSQMTRNPVMVLQAYSWSIDFPDFNPDWPSASEMRQMRNQATRCGDPKLMMWFCFHCITDYNPNPDAYWRQLAWAANGVTLGPNYRMTSHTRAG